MQETQVQSLISEDPTCFGTAKTLCHNIELLNLQEFPYMWRVVFLLQLWRFSVYLWPLTLWQGLPRWLKGRESACQRRRRRRPRFDPWVWRSPRGENGNPLQSSCLKNSMDREAWWAAVHELSKSQIWLSRHASSLGNCSNVWSHTAH